MNSCEYSRLGSRQSDFQEVALLQAAEEIGGALMPDLPTDSSVLHYSVQTPRIRF